MFFIFLIIFGWASGETCEDISSSTNITPEIDVLHILPNLSRWSSPPDRVGICLLNVICPRPRSFRVISWETKASIAADCAWARALIWKMISEIGVLRKSKRFIPEIKLSWYMDGFTPVESQTMHADVFENFLNASRSEIFSLLA